MDFKYLKDFMTLQEAVEMTGLSKAALNQHIRRGNLKKYKLHGNKILLERKDVEAFNTPQPVAANI